MQDSDTNLFDYVTTDFLDVLDLAVTLGQCGLKIWVRLSFRFWL